MADHLGLGFESQTRQLPQNLHATTRLADLLGIDDPVGPE